jgi:hypothetical protein
VHEVSRLRPASEPAAAAPVDDATHAAGPDRYALAEHAHRLARSMHREGGAARSVWQGIEATVRQGATPTAPPPPERSSDPQSGSGRSARAGDATRERRATLVKQFNNSLDELGLAATDPAAATFADDIGRELDLLNRRAEERA